MNFEKNGQPQNDKNRERVDDQNIDQNAEVDVKLTALALGEISDPDEANRLKALIEQDDDRRKEYESTAHLASMIRDSVENDLPLAPGSIHDVVVAALSKRAGGAQSADESTTDEPSSAPQKKIAAQSSQSWWSANGRMVSYVSALSVLGIAIAMTLYMQDWNRQPENVARHDATTSEDESRKTDEMSVLSNGGVEDGRFRYMEDASSVKRKRAGTEAKISGQVPVGNESLEFRSDAQEESDKYEGLQIKKGAARGSLDDMRLNETQKVELDGKASRPSALNSITRNFNIETAKENKFRSEPKNQPNGDGTNFFNPPGTKLELSIAKNPSATKPGKMGLDRSNSDSGIRRSGDASRGKPNTARSFKKSAPPNSPAFGGGGAGGSAGGGQGSGGLGGGGLGGGGFGSGQNSARGAGAAGRSVGRSGGQPGDTGGNPNRYSRSTNDGVQKSAAPALGMAQPKAGGKSRGVRGGIEKADSDQSLKQAIGGRMKSTESAKGKNQSGQGERLQGQPMRSRIRPESENNSSSNGLNPGYGLKPRLRMADSKQKDASKAPSSRPNSRSGIDKFGDTDLNKADGNLGADFRQKEELKKYKKDIKSIKTELEQAKPLQQNSANGSRWEGKLPKKAGPGGSTGRAASGGADPTGSSPNDTKAGEANPKQTAKAGFKSGDNPGQAGGAESAPVEMPTPKSGVLGGEALKKGFADPKKGQDKSATNNRRVEAKSDKTKAIEMRKLPLDEKNSVEEKKRELAKDNPAAGAIDETLEEEKAETDDLKARLQKKIVEKKLADEMEDAETEDLLERDFEILQIDPSLENDFIQPIGTNARSTFSADTDTVSFTNVRQMLRNGVFPHPEQVRIEEMINYFDFKYEQPKAKEKFSVNMELASSPWNPGNKILKIGLQAREVSNADRPPSNLVFLVDVSGSMRERNKLPLLQKGLKKMVGKLREDDYVSIVTYANQIKVPLQPTDGSQKGKINAVIDSLKAAGGTNGGEGLQQAYRLAEENLYEDGTNRIVLGTDGDFNLGIKNDRELAMLVKKKADTGVFLTVCGFGTDNFKDQKMQIMSQNGNGKVYYIDSEAEAQRVFADEISGSLVTIAKDVKLQLLFNPRTVQSYRLIGYENRMLTAQDFDNHKKDAGEINAGDSVTALYEIVPGDGDFTFPTNASTPKPIDLKYQLVQKESIELTKVAASNDLAALRIRFKAPNASVDSESEEREFVVKNSNTKFNRASKEFQLSTAVAGLGMMLRGSKHRGTLNFENLKEFGQTVLADRPTAFAGKKDTSGEKELGEDPVKLRKRRAQRQEVLELINRAADLYEQRKR